MVGGMLIILLVYCGGIGNRYPVCNNWRLLVQIFFFLGGGAGFIFNFSFFSFHLSSPFFSLTIYLSSQL